MTLTRRIPKRMTAPRRAQMAGLIRGVALCAPLMLVTSLAGLPLAAAPPPLELPAPQPAPSPVPTPAPAPLELPPPAAATPTAPRIDPATPQPPPAATPRAADRPRAAAPSAEPTGEPAPAVTTAGAGEAPATADAGEALLLPAENAPQPNATAPQAASSAVGDSVLPEWWPWLSGALIVIAVLIGVQLGMRRRQPKVLQLAAPAKGAVGSASTNEDPVPARLDCQLDIISASRSVMMFTIEYRLEIANRSERAVRDLAVTTRLGYPGRTGEEAALAPGAEHHQTLERIGPHQSRSVTGTLRLPLADIAPIRQGAAPLLIPLLHVFLEGPAQPRAMRVFVAGTPSPANLGRLQPIRLDTTPGGIAGVRALPVNAP